VCRCRRAREQTPVEELGDVLRRHWTAQQVALHVLTAELAQFLVLRVGLHALCRHRQGERVAHLDDRSHDGLWVPRTQLRRNLILVNETTQEVVTLD